MAGVGTIIKKELAAWGIHPKAGCGCISLAAKMDRVGVDMVERELDSYTNQMYDSIKEWRGTSRLPIPQPPKLVIRTFIKYAIEKNR